MSNETTNPVVKWILIGIIVVSVCVIGAFVLLGTYPAEEYRVARELESRGFTVYFEWQGNNIWKYPALVRGEDRSITEDDSRLIGQLTHLKRLEFRRSDLSGLNLDKIGNCRELEDFQCENVTPFPVDEIRKLAACPIIVSLIYNSCLNDSDLEVLAEWPTVRFLNLNANVEITDAGFEHLEKIASLTTLLLEGTSVTKEGVEEFKKKRPDVNVWYDGMP